MSAGCPVEVIGRGGSGFKVQGSGFRVQGSGFRVAHQHASTSDFVLRVYMFAAASDCVLRLEIFDGVRLWETLSPKLRCGRSSFSSPLKFRV